MQDTSTYEAVCAIILMIGVSAAFTIYFTTSFLTNYIKTIMAKTEQEILDELDGIKAKQEQTSAALANIQGDATNLLAQIADLKNKLANAGVLSQAVQDKLDEVSASAGAIASTAQSIADSVPDAPEQED